MLSGREASVRRLDLLRAAVGDAPADWYPALTGHGWPGGGKDLLDDELAFDRAAE